MATGKGPEDNHAKLVELLGSGSVSDMTSGTLIVVPSITFPESELRKIMGIQYYEERLLFLLSLLRHPEMRVVFVTSLRVEEPIIDYYLRFVPSEVSPGDRLYLIALWDQEARALTHKLLEQDWAVKRLSELGRDACLLTFNVTEAERDLAEAIGVPLYGCRPDLVWLGSKSGSRKVAREAGVEVLPGAEDLFSQADLEAAIERLRQTDPAPGACVIKLNNGFSGQGNVIVELDGEDLPLRERRHRFCADDESWDSYLEKVEAEGAVIEELIRKPGVVSPSVQVRVGPDGTFEILSTHDQILGGPDDQVYLGCRFPADPAYRLEIQEIGARVGKALAGKGVIGSFGIDLLVDRSGTEPVVYLSEINLRLGGTTHPYLMAKHVTGGTYDAATGDLLVDGGPRYYVSTDNLKEERYKGMAPEHLISAVDAAGLAFDPATKTGVTLHLLGALKRFGKVGAVAIGTSPDEADEIYAAFVGVLDAASEEVTSSSGE